MAVEIRVPVLGESIVDAVVSVWLKHEGDSVQQGDVLLELETDKINVEVSAEQSGVLQQITRKEGDTVAVGEVIGVISEKAGAQTAPVAATPAPAAAQTAPPPPPVSASAPELATPLPAPQAEPAPPVAAGHPMPPTPLARRVAAEHDIDLAQVKTTSPQGRITKDDVLSYLEQNSSRPAAQPASATEPPASPTSAPAWGASMVPDQAPAAPPAPAPPQQAPTPAPAPTQKSARYANLTQWAGGTGTAFATAAKLSPNAWSRLSIMPRCSQPLTR